MKIQANVVSSNKLIQVRAATGLSLGQLIAEAIDLLAEKYQREVLEASLGNLNKDDTSKAKE
jgi:hypothetical protein